MQSVFVSYSHQDAAFADRLVGDLQLSAIPATYDKWLLRVGDSIIEKISSAVASASSVIAVLSPSSIGSRWVAKELSMAMMGEVNAHDVRVLPAVVSDCEIPPMLADKLHADFRISYYAGLRQLLRALHRTESDDLFSRKESIERDRSELADLLATSESQRLRVWFLTHGYALAALLGRLWTVSEAIPEFSLAPNEESVDFVVVNGQSFHYELSLVRLGPRVVTDADRNAVMSGAHDLEQLLSTYRNNERQFRKSVAARLESRYGAHQIRLGDADSFARGLRLDAKLLCGRRSDFERDANQLRLDVFAGTKEQVEVVSYDRVLDAIDRYLVDR